MRFSHLGVSHSAQTAVPIKAHTKREKMKLLATITAASLIISGCAWFQTTEENTPDQLVSDGMYYFDDGDYRDAIESFEKLKDWYPFSKYTALAQLKIADAYFRLEEFTEAIYAYEEFDSLHPRNEAIPYVIHQIGLCYFNQMDSVDRDQTSTRKALETFRRLVSQFPDSEYTVSGREYIKVCQKNLAAHEFYVGMFYYKNEYYKPALYRFRAVLSNYPDVGIHQEALRYIALCEASLAKAQETKNE